MKTIDREPLVFSDENDYIDYLGNASTPTLLTDDKNLLIQKIKTEFPNEAISIKDSTARLKEL
ncbi:MAG: AlwI family type II restriction endonuclease, partial [Bacteroidales bacterium]|nr:AlwI family type II restriction endonuclease [Bacteroidales bacterium]